MEKQEHILKYKLAYTAMIIVMYLMGRNIPLFGIDYSSRMPASLNVQTLLMQTISGDADRCSLFVLGISPIMLSSILIQIFVSLRDMISKTRLSLRKMGRMRMILIVGFALYQALRQISFLSFKAEGTALLWSKIIVVSEMIAGVMLILWLAGRNQKYGIGGQAIFIYVNTMSRIMAALFGHSMETFLLPLVISLVVMVITLIMEGGEKRIPMQRISIYNVYADKNYLAIKMNPVGVMPVMFAMAFFTLPQMAADGLHLLFPANVRIIWWQENLVLTRLLGIGVYIFILYFLTIGFSMISISPSRIAEQFLKGGDSILNLHAGRATRRYLFRQVLGIGFFSATLMSLCLGIPMFLQLKGNINQELAMFPSSIMILTSLWYNLYDEVITLKSYEAYKPFI